MGKFCQFLTVICPQCNNGVVLLFHVFIMQLFLKIFSGMANSVYPDQTGAFLQEPSDLGLQCLYMPFCNKFGA